MPITIILNLISLAIALLLLIPTMRDAQWKDFAGEKHWWESFQVCVFVLVSAVSAAELLNYTPLIYVPLFVALNRMSGNDEWFPARNIYGTSILAGLSGLIISGPLVGALLFLSMLTYRIPGWTECRSIGKLTGRVKAEFFGYMWRSTWFTPILLIDLDWIMTPLLILFLGLGGAISNTIGFYLFKRNHALPAEIINGAVLGLTVMAVTL